MNKIDKWEEYREEILRNIEEKFPDPESSFYILLRNLKNKLFSDDKKYNLVNMIMEFNPGSILSAIFKQKSLIIKDMTQAKSIVLERFIELFSEKHSLTLVEDINETFTTKENKILFELNDSFKVIATCKVGDELKLSESLLSYFTVIACSPYSEKEEEIVLHISDEDMNLINKLAPNFNLTKKLNCVRITKKLDNNIKNKNHEENLRIVLYVFQKGLIKQKGEEILKLKKDFNLHIPDYEDGICPFIYSKENQYFRSIIFDVKMHSFQRDIRDIEFDKEIIFTKNISEICDTILFALSLRIPIIIEGEEGQGKQTAINYMAKILGLDIIKIDITKYTKVDDLLFKKIIKKTNGEILVKNQETELFKAINCYDNYPRIILFQGINNASNEVLGLINSIFSPDDKITLPNGSFLNKGNIYIIGVFNKRKDNINKNIIPDGILSNCIYHVMGNPSNEDIANITFDLFRRMDFKRKKQYEEEFQKDKMSEAKDFIKKYLFVKNFSIRVSNESPVTLNDIKNYIDFRQAIPHINYLVIQLFIFAYHFSQEEYINKITEELNLLKDIEFLPVIDYDEDKENLFIKLNREEKESIRVKVANPRNIKIKKNKKLFDTLTKSQKQCFFFLICCIISKKTPIIKGPTASGKSYLLSAFATILGQETNLYQMNSSTYDKSILTGYNVIKGNFDDNDKKTLENAYNSIKEEIHYNRSFNDMKLKHYKKIIDKIDKELGEDINNNKLKEARKIISNIISPGNQFIHIDSEFIDSIIKDKGQWVILDGIEMARPQIIDKIAPLCGENPHLNSYDYKNFEIKNITINDIKDNFQLFIIYNPFNKSSKIIDQLLFEKCPSFTLPSLDNSQFDSASLIFNSIRLSIDSDKNIWNILCSKLAASHILSVKISENHLDQMVGGIKITPRNLAFILKDKINKEFDEKNSEEIVKWLKSVLTFYYFNSFIDLNDINKKEYSNIYTKDQFIKDVYNEFNKKQELLNDISDISENDIMSIIDKELREIQIDSLNETSKFSFNFGKFVKLCLDIPINKENLENIKNQIEDTINLLNYSNLSKESLYSFYQIKIVEKFYSDLLGIIDSIQFENPDYKINSNELLKNKLLKPILLKFRLLEGLTNIGKSNFGYCMNPNLYMSEINQLIYKLNTLVLKKNKMALKEFVSFIFYNHHFLKVIETIFPYNKFNEECNGKDFEIAFYYIKMMIEFYKNKTNFVFIFDNEEIPFIFEENQYNRLFPFLNLNEKKNIFLSKGTTIKYYSSKKCKKPTNITLINEKENVNKIKTVFYVKFLTENSGKINIRNINNLISTFNKYNCDLISDKKFLFSNLFLNNKNSIIPKIWTLLLSFNEDSELLEYIIDNLLPFEKDIFYIIKNNYYDTLNRKYQIEDYIKFTEKMNFFYNEESFLYRDLIGRLLQTELRDEQFKNYETKIENEILNIEELREFSWPEESINEYLQILKSQQDKLKEMIKLNQKSVQLKKKLLKLKEELKKAKLERGLETNKRNIMNKIDRLYNGNLDEILRETQIIEKEINELVGKNLNNQNFDVEKEINKKIEKIKNFKQKKLKLDEVSEDKLIKLYNSDKLKELLKRTIIIQEESPINKLLECSKFLSCKIFSEVSQLNLLQEIPFKNLEINILLDCSRTIEDNEKFYVILQVCALTTVFHALEVPYLISVIGENGFKVVLKDLDDEHSLENLQKVLDCIFIKRGETNIASCVKTAIDKFKTLNQDSQRVFYIFTNGLDEEFALYDQWEERILNNPKHSFTFIFSKSESINNEQSEFLTQFWEKFIKYCKSKFLLVEFIEMNKEKLDNIKINEENLNNYIKAIVNALIRYEKKDNDDITEIGIFKIDKCNNIPSNENLENIGKMIKDKSIKEIKEEPYFKKISLPHQQEEAPNLNQKEFIEISKNLNSILKIQVPINDNEKNRIIAFMKLFKIKKEKINTSFLELIFKQHLKAQNILTDIGTNIDIYEYLKFLISPIENPRIFREIDFKFIQKYRITVVIDSSVSCFSLLSCQHTWNTIQVLLSSLGAINLPYFSLIITGSPNPYVVCSYKNTLDVLSEKSQIWPILFDLLNKKVKNTDLASAIKAAYNLSYLINSDYIDFLFVITDGLFSLSETQRIVQNVNFCMMKGLNVFGIGVGISPFGIEKLFPNIIYSMNPDKLIQGIASCFLDVTSKNSSMKNIISSLETKLTKDN